MTLPESPVRTADPYVGPQAYQRGQALYGRDVETLDLLDRLIAERIVLLHSPSGAGKTSLVQAKLVPALESDGFEVLPTVRVTAELPSDDQRDVSPRNRYVFATLLSLESNVPPDQQQDIERLAQMTIADYLAVRPDLDDRPGNEVLVLDQFEEVITADPTDQDAKYQFFSELGLALRDRKLWALFLIREEYLANLDPYSRLVPTRFVRRFRLELLTIDQATDAIVLPARGAGVEFDPAAAAKLVDDLRLVSVQRGDVVSLEPGPHVEPVQLQVVCQRLWSRLTPGAREVRRSDVEALGDVDQALEGYYADRVALTAVTTGIAERALRDWFGGELITPQGLRSQVLNGPRRPNGSDQEVLDSLLDAHLVRMEERRGAIWYELAHDRLVRPIRADNERWRAENLSDFERAAELWAQQSRRDELLITRPALDAAETGLAERSDPLSETEQEFLTASRSNQERLDHEKRAHQRIRRGLQVAVGCLALAFAALVYALIQTHNADVQRTQAEANALAAEKSALVGEGLGQIGFDADLSLLLGQSAAVWGGAEGPLDEKTQGLLQLAVDETPVIMTLPGHRPPAKTVSWSQDGTMIVTGDADAVRLWDPDTGKNLRKYRGIRGVETVDISADGSYVAAGGAEPRVAIWPVDQSRQPVFVDVVDARKIRGIALSPDGGHVAVAGGIGVLIADTVSGAPGQRLVVPVAPVPGEAVAIAADVEWLPGGDRVVAVDDLGGFAIWDVADESRLSYQVGHAGFAATTVDVSLDGELAATGGNDGTAVIWDVATGTQRASVVSPAGLSIRGVSFGSAADGTPVLVVVDHGGNAVVVDPSTGVTRRTVTADGMKLTEVDVDPLHADRAVVSSVAGNPAVWDITVGQQPQLTDLDVGADGTALTASPDGTIALWSPDQRLLATIEVDDLGLKAAAMSADHQVIATVGADLGPATIVVLSGTVEERRIDLPGTAGLTRTVAVDPTGRYVATAGLDETVHVWDGGTGEVVANLTGHTASIIAVAFGSGPEDLVSVSEDGTAIVWGDLATSGRRATLPLGGFPSAVAWSLRGDRLAVAIDDRNVVELWDTDSEELVDELAEHTSKINDLAFDDSGAFLVTAGSDRWIVGWDAGSGERLQGVRHRFPVLRVAFSGRRNLLAVSDRGSPYVVYTAGSDVLAAAEQRTTRQLSDAECRRYLGSSCPPQETS